MCKSLPNYSNGVCEVVLVKFKKLDTIFGVLYRSPDTALEEWKKCVKVVEEEINLTQAHGDYWTLVLIGDLIFPSLK